MDSLKLRGVLTIEHRAVDGSLISRTETKNTITNAGKAEVAGLVGNTGSPVAFTYLAVGTSTTSPAASQTALGAEITTGGLARAAATISRTTTTVTNDTVRFVYTWTASASHAVEEVGIFNAASSGDMLGRALTGTKNLVSGETLTVTYDVAFA